MPEAQPAQADLPAVAWYWPFVQLMQDALPSSFMYDPVPQSVHVAAPELAWPTGPALPVAQLIPLHVALPASSV